nr:MAG TPA: nuclear pore complex protein [Caudoviricetes sp.]
MNGVYIPISEFARLIGVSTQAVRTKKGIDAYVRDTKPKTIDIAAAFLYEMEINIDGNGNMCVGNVGNTLGENVDSVENNKINAENTEKAIAENDIDNTMRDIVDMLRNELSRKNEQLTTMEARIAEKDATIMELTQKLTELVQKEQEISQNAIAALQQRNYIEEHKNILEAERQGSVVDVLCNLDNNGGQQQHTHKKGFMSWFERKKR